MDREYESSSSSLTWMAVGFSLGALTMYLLDPDRGNRRRALVSDKMHSAAVSTRKAIDKKSRHLANRAQGLRAEMNQKVVH